MTFTQNKWLTSWLEMEHASKNIGIDYVINPTLYPEIIDAVVQTQSPITLYDFGCGTSSLGVDILIRNPKNVPGLTLRSYKEIQRTREKIDAYRGYEIESTLVNHANERFAHFGIDHMRTTQHHVAQSIAPLHSAQAVAVSRNLLMHLSGDDLRIHLQHTAQLVGKNGYYIFSVLNPDYEQRKHPSHLREEQQYFFEHGSNGELGSFTHYFRSQNRLITYLTLFFHTKKILECRPMNDDFMETHRRYYNPNIPIAFVYVTQAKMM